MGRDMLEAERVFRIGAGRRPVNAVGPPQRIAGDRAGMMARLARLWRIGHRASNHGRNKTAN